MGEAARKRRAALQGDAKGTFADKITLAEVAENDLNMVKDAIKNANRYHFGHDMRKAIIFVRVCVDATMKRLGIVINPPKSADAQKLYADALDKEMADKQVRIETRNKYQGSDIWRNGIYIYQRDELVAFISDVLTTRRTEMEPGTLKITKESIGYMVVTNARLDDTKRIYLMPGAGATSPTPALTH